MESTLSIEEAKQIAYDNVAPTKQIYIFFTPGASTVKLVLQDREEEGDPVSSIEEDKLCIDNVFKQATKYVSKGRSVRIHVSRDNIGLQC